ncbi:MAG: sugar ABC transporter permease [Actinobacteria bacterium]|nr:MAG: sugar ABC transporter permease [Actinomycetota bacterium]
MSIQPIPTQLDGPPPSEGRRLRPWSAFERVQGMLFVLPALVVLAIFLIYPAYYTIRLAFYEGDFHFGFFHYLGIQNFKELLTNDKDFLDLSKFPPSGALINNVRWVIFYISLSLLIGLGLAVLAVRVRYERAVKTAIFVPMAISATAVGIIWLFVYSPSPDMGVLNALLHAFDSGFHPVAWLGRPNLVNYALIFAYVWASVGFVMVVLSAAIKGIPAEIMEAARVDGAGEWNIFRRIMLPMLSLPLSVVTIWLFINVIKVFDIIYVMTGGGPGTSSRVIAFTMYEETFQNGRPGYGAAVAVIMLVLIAPVMVLNVRRFRSEKVVA